MRALGNGFGKMSSRASYEAGQQVMQQLQDSDARTQEQGLQAIASMGAEGGQYADAVASKLKSDDKQVRKAALSTLSCLGKAASIHARSVEALLDDQDLDVVVDACTALGGLQAHQAAGRLVMKLQHEDADVVHAACSALSTLNMEVQSVGLLLTHKEPRVRAAACGALKNMNGAEPFAAQAAPLVGDADGYVRLSAAGLFCSLGDKAAAQASTIGKFLSSPDCGVVAAAATSLGGIGAAAASEVPLLEAALSNDGEDVSSLPLTTAGIAPRLAASLRKPACAAAQALSSIGAAGSKSAAKVAECLNSKDWEIRAAACQALGKMGGSAAHYEYQITGLLKDPAPSVVAAASLALGYISAASAGGPSASTASEMAELLEHTHPSVRARAAQSLGLMRGEDGAQAHVEALVELFGDRSWPVQVEAIKAVVGCGLLGQMYASDVCRLLYAESPQVRATACAGLSMMGRRGAAFDDEVQQLLDDVDNEVASAAKRALEAFTKAPYTALSDTPVNCFSPVRALVDEPPAPVIIELAVPKVLPAPVKALPAAAPVAVAPRPQQPTIEEVEEVFVSSSSSQPPLPVALLFPGQGSQYVKMLTDVKDLPGVKIMLDKAREILGYDILKLCLEGPEEELEQTKNCQPAMYIAGLAALELLKKNKPELAERPQAVAGLSLGEYTALTAAGVFDFETGLELVRLRGEAMQEAASSSPQMMCSIAGLTQEVIEKICKESINNPEDVCQVANFLFPNGFSCAGSKDAVERMLEKANKTPGVLQAKPLKTSGAFHTKLMAPAQAKLLIALHAAEAKMHPPTCEVYMNVTGKKIAPGTPVSEIIPLLSEQLCGCVLWDPCVRAMIGEGVQEFYECGPMKQLKAMMKRIAPEKWSKTQNIHV